jgi:ubiquinol-cytochrome c reductase iron-sulfur subunit
LGIALFALGYGLVVWGRRLLPHREEVQQREPLVDSPEAIAEVVAALEEGGVLERRKLLQRLLVGAGAALGLAALFPIRSLGPSPGGALKHTPWTNGLRVVDQSGRPVRVADVPFDGLVTVFPEGYVGSANGQAVLVRVRPELLNPLPARAEWSPQGFVAYSKVCSHAGCPVGLYQAHTHSLLCPCHQSTFDVLRHARPTFGPAARPLPQLPLRINGQGELEAMGDFSDPVGPAWWTRP